MNQIKASEIKPGMIVDYYDGRMIVSRVKVSEYGSVMISDHCHTRGLSASETVTVVGHFNP